LDGAVGALNGDLLGFPVGEEDRVVAAFRATGYRRVRDQQGIERANGHAELPVARWVMVIFPRGHIERWDRHSVSERANLEGA
jgi:hypothetical protein